MADQPSDVPRVFWLSFASEGRSLGVIVVDATTFEEAYRTVNFLGLNPGGECQGAGFNPAALDDADRADMAKVPRETLLTLEQLTAMGVQVFKGHLPDDKETD